MVDRHMWGRLLVLPLGLPLGLVGISRIRGGLVDIGAAVGQLQQVDDATRVVVGPELATLRGALQGGHWVRA
jgi:hypothetical protein